MSDFKFEEYLSQDEMKDIAKEAFRSKCEESLEKDFDRVLGNIAYDVIWKASDDVLNGELHTRLQERVHKVIDNLTEFAVFKSPDSWGRDSNSAYKLLQDVVVESKPLIEDRVKTIINSFDGSDFNLDVNCRLEDRISQRLFGEK